MPTAIVYGPPACGKTRHAKQIAEDLGIDPAYIVDDWSNRGGRYPYLQPGYLHLCHAVPVKILTGNGMARPIPRIVIVRPFSSFILEPHKRHALRIVAKYAHHQPGPDAELVDAIPNRIDRELALRAALEERFGDVADIEFSRWRLVADVLRWAEGRAGG